MKFFKPSRAGGFSLLTLIFTVAILALLAAVAIPKAAAQIQTSPGLTTPVAFARVYPLTNANTFTLASGGTNLATASLTVINSTPFPVPKGRGFSYVLEYVGTNSNANVVTPFFQVGTPITNGSTFTTNWSQYIPGSAIAANGTTRVYAFAVVPPTTIDNAQLARLAVVSNAHSASTTLSSTNSYAIVMP